MIVWIVWVYDPDIEHFVFDSVWDDKDRCLEYVDRELEGAEEYNVVCRRFGCSYR